MLAVSGLISKSVSFSKSAYVAGQAEIYRIVRQVHSCCLIVRAYLEDLPSYDFKDRRDKGRREDRNRLAAGVERKDFYREPGEGDVQREGRLR